ncbi:hypothetical protein D3C77_638710 [compost metagenome]
MEKTIHTERRTHILQYLQLHLLLRIRQLEGQAAYELADRRIIDLMLDPVHALVIHRPVGLQFQLEQKQLLIDHPPPRLLPFLAVLRLMNPPNRLPPRH